MRLILLSLIISVAAEASSWAELVTGKTYKLVEEFQLQLVERSGSLLDFSKGESVRLKEVVTERNVTLYVFDYTNCPGAALKTRMEVVPLYGEVEAKVAGCELNMYLETKNLYYKSLFE